MCSKRICTRSVSEIASMHHLEEGNSELDKCRSSNIINDVEMYDNPTKVVSQNVNMYNNRYTNSSVLLIDIDQTYKMMTHGRDVYMCQRNEGCLNIKRPEIGRSNLIVYTGLCKKRENIRFLLSQGVECTVVYNIREIKMLNDEGMKYILKIKLTDLDIGIHIDTLDNILCQIQFSRPENFCGFYITVNKKWFTEYVRKKYLIDDDQYSSEVFKEISMKITDIVDIIRSKDLPLHLVVLDITDINGVNDNTNASNVMLKLSVHNYINIGKRCQDTDCVVI